jgi:hypothetical protein
MAPRFAKGTAPGVVPAEASGADGSLDGLDGASALFAVLTNPPGTNVEFKNWTHDARSSATSIALTRKAARKAAGLDGPRPLWSRVGPVAIRRSASRTRLLVGAAVAGTLACLMVWLVMPKLSDPVLRHAQHDPARAARIVARRALLYAEGADPTLDRPAYVRAASGIAWLGTELVAVQDDARFVARIEPTSGRASAIALPPGPDGKRLHDTTRGTKALKLDFEACFTVVGGTGTELFAVGSGSSDAREQIARIRFGVDGRMADLELATYGALYQRLRETTSFSGSELNVEGAVARGDELLLFQRGNGAVREGVSPTNAIAELPLAAFLAYVRGEAASPPAISRVQRFDLGTLDGVPFTFTDATWAHDELTFVASAEASPDTIQDGVVLGTRIGSLGSDGAVRTFPLLDEQGAAARIKAEGITRDPTDPSRLYLVVDMDDPALPSELLTVTLR